MSLYLRLTALGVAAILMLAWPVGDTTVLLALMIAADAVLLLLILAPLIDNSRVRQRLAAVLPFGSTAASLKLMRRTVPALRSRRPANVIDAQIRWRRTAAANRRKREVAPVVHIKK